ncbi:Nucleoside diphosphate-linked moiety X motif 6 [Larimichthys crocea]|uniref:Uncharacterized protein n=1 Tax=Larimichthys crocea TaxID=215358 RepID=A0ACD3RCY1_LARCR|nr:Nucleoside diphosphate-linked moiety X motif 6 [Larimichthys crocea]
MNMAACVFVFRLFPPLRGRRSAVRLFSCASTRFRHHDVNRTSALTGKVDRFGGVTVNLAELGLPADISESSFSRLLQDSLLQWKAEGKAAVWLRVPISLSRCAAAASTHGFTFHHAKGDHAVLALWLREGQSRLPGFATHQIGVAGAVVDESNGKVLVVQDRNKTKNAWKFPWWLV